MESNGSRTGRRAVMVTGTSTGIGEACVAHLHGLDFEVFAGVRRAEDGEKLRARVGERVVPVEIDVTDAATIARAREQVGEAVEGRGLAGLVNNAGVTVSGPIEFVRIDDLRRQLEVNTIGQVAVTQAFMPAVRAAPGRVVFIGSIGGRLAAPFNGPYSASKFAIEAISDALRRELRPWGMSVSLIEPGAISTEIWRKGLETFDAEVEKLGEEGRRLYGQALTDFAAVAKATGARGIPASKVAEAVGHALTSDRPKTRYLVGRDAKAMAALAAIAPDRTADRLIERQMQSEARKAR